MKNKILKIALGSASGAAITLLIAMPILAATQDEINASSTAFVDGTGAILFGVLLSVGLTLAKWFIPLGLAIYAYHKLRGRGRVRA